MDVWRPRRWAVGSASGLTVTCLAVIAHRAAGGTVGVAGLLIALSVVCVTAGEMSRWIRLDFAGVLLAAVVAQPALHVVLGLGGSHSHSHSHHAALVAASSSSSPAQMWIAHAVLAATAAVVVRWGGRWLRGLPNVVRAIVGVGQRASAQPLAELGVVFGPVRPALASHAAVTLGCRGPPSGA